MFRVLLESQPPRAPRRGGALLSLVTHAALIGGAIFATVGENVASPVPDPPVPVDITWTRAIASSRDGAAARGHTPSLPQSPRPVIGPVTIDVPSPTSIDFDPGPIIDRPHEGLCSGDACSRLGSGSPFDGTTPNASAEPLTGRDLYARLAGEPRRPHYPDTMRSAGVEGTVVVQFVVDTVGRIEPASVRVVSATNAAFADAVLAVLPSYRFQPGVAQGRAIRMLAEMPFAFTVRKP